MNLFITFVYDEKMYKIDKNYLQLPILVPGLEYPFSTYIRSISNQLLSDNIKVNLKKMGK